MAIKVESFLVIEKSLASKLDASWRRKTAPVLAKIQKAVAKQDFNDAYALVNTLTMAGVSKANDKFLELAGTTSVLFGASQLTPPKQSSFKETGKPVEVDKSSENLKMSLATSGTEQVRFAARKAIAEEELRQMELSQEVQKAATDTFTKTFVSSVSKAGKSSIDIGSSLHTSRLASWGFTIEAEVTGVTSYKVSEQLDSRTCLVCREMHGKVFPVAPTKIQLERQLSVDDPNDLKSMAPWPKQDAASINRLRNMNTSELMGAGYATPPYHPLCRGVLVPSSTASDVAAVSPPPAANDPVSFAEIRKVKDSISIKDSLEPDEIEAAWPELFGTVRPEAVASSLSTMSKTVGTPVRMSLSQIGTKNPVASFGGKDGQFDMRRTITIGDDGKKIVKHDFLSLAKDQQGQGIGKSLLGEQMALYEQMGVSRVDMFANIDVGGYAWPRYGFTPDANDWGILKRAAKSNLNKIDDIAPDVRSAVEELLKSDDPKTAWMLADLEVKTGGTTLGKRLMTRTAYTANLDLFDGEAMTRFKSYISRGQ